MTVTRFMLYVQLYLYDKNNHYVQYVTSKWSHYKIVAGIPLNLQGFPFLKPALTWPLPRIKIANHAKEIWEKGIKLDHRSFDFCSWRLHAILSHKPCRLLFWVLTADRELYASGKPTNLWTAIQTLVIPIRTFTNTEDRTRFILTYKLIYIACVQPPAPDYMYFTVQRWYFLFDIECRAHTSVDKIFVQKNTYCYDVMVSK